MTLLVKDANTSMQSLSTVTDGNGNLVPLHVPAVTNAQGVASPVSPQNPLPVVNTAATAASDGSGIFELLRQQAETAGRANPGEDRE